MLTHVKISDLAKQWELAAIWMRDTNMPSTLSRAFLTRDVAGAMLDQYFNMVEQIFSQSRTIASDHRPVNQSEH
jgi:hypothetical protein